ncbi:helix-turn-helix domain-containing protein [Microbulbifer sp. VAAF005]|uniref:helix-turn-helix domain-containing protein n=1 Tax=Microbulbifer sp. VAAF005 TaxID=3034230 RepID=UPI0024ADAC0B|nr:helix-turn-helix domain-containing protein [Microbulbifer sp. VAAF005]WHI48949.1 helix-turn-helix domain-containing protein [Microbulbifer sp. VAAF005]
MSDELQNLDRYLTFCQSNGVTETGLRIVEEIISNPPARRVRTRSMGPNITSRFPSHKMGLTIQAESRTLELSSIYLKEFDPKVLGYWDQPFHKVVLSYRSGKRYVRVPTTLDFFVIADGFIGFEECKPFDALQKLASKTPGRYQWNEELKCFEIPPMADYLEGTGLAYRIVSDKEINPIYIDNLALLYNYLPDMTSEEDQRLWTLCKELLLAKGPQPFNVLEGSIAGVTRDRVMQAIAQQSLYVDLQNCRLNEPERVLIAAEPNQLKGVMTQKTSDFVRDRIILDASPKEIEASLARINLVNSVLAGESVVNVANKAKVSVRTLQRWLSAYRKKGIDGLQPEHHKKGNYVEKLPEELELIIQQTIESNFLNSDNQNFPHIYGLICGECTERGLVPPSKKSVRRRILPIAEVVSKKVREGAKSAYQYTTYQGVDGKHKELPLIGVNRFLQRCHIDHTQIDLQLVSVEGVNLGKPWLTTIVDEYSGYVLSCYLSFRHPSNISVMSALRLMVKTHEIFPEAVVVDGGKEFQSIYFETLMARYRTTIISREGKPRSGSAVERNFGSLNTIFLDNLSGSNKLAKNIREVSKSHNPENLSIWEPVDFYHGLLQYIDKFNHQSIKTGGLSPAQIRDKSIERFGLSYSRKIEFNEIFLMNVLLPPARSGTKLKRNSAIQVNRVRYWHICLKSASRESIAVDIRFDPFDLNYIFVFYQNRWIRFQATKPQHRRVDELEGAILAEVARQTLYINERSKDTGRADLAGFVEELNQGAKANLKKRELSSGSSSNKFKVNNNQFGTPGLEESECDEWSSVDWDISIPDSDEEV